MTSTKAVKAAKSAKGTRKEGKKQLDMEALRDFVRTQAATWLEKPNINSVGIGYREVDGQATKEIAIQFTVDQKAKPEMLESLGTERIPKSFRVGKVEVPTDVVERKYQVHYQLLAERLADPRKSRAEKLQPGISISYGHPEETAGTLGLFVYDVRSGARYMLSNWHVLHGNRGTIGGPVVQPGVHDDNRIPQNVVGRLVRSHLGVAGDCAIATVENRQVLPMVLDLRVTPKRLARVELGDHVLKSGRTTNVTHGLVKRVDVTTKINYGGPKGPQAIGGFEIGPHPKFPAANGEISMGGDSGSAWLAATKSGKASDIFVGLHFAGESSDDDPEHAVACYAHSVLAKLEVTLRPPAKPVGGEKGTARAGGGEGGAPGETTAGIAGNNIAGNSVAGSGVAGSGVAAAATGAATAVAKKAAKGASNLGYQSNFLAQAVPLPKLTASLQRAAAPLKKGKGNLLHYRHYTLVMHGQRRFAIYAAWHIDGTLVRKPSGLDSNWRIDERLDAKFQVDNKLYANNRLDRGHIAKREDLVWGETLEEAREGNDASFHWTNCTPQHEGFNKVIWKDLEDQIFAETKMDGHRMTVFAGPVYRPDDPVYRGLQIPKDFWKIICFVEPETQELVTAAFVLTQQDLLNQIEGAFPLDEFRVFQVAVRQIEGLTGLAFAAAMHRADRSQPATEGLEGPMGAQPVVVEVKGVEDVLLGRPAVRRAGR